LGVLADPGGDREGVGMTRPSGPPGRAARLGAAAAGSGPAARLGAGRAGLAAGLAGLAAGVIVGGWPGAVVAVAVVPAVWFVLRRLEPAAARRQRLAAAADLPIAVDLLAATLRAGAPMSHAATAVGEALGGPVGERLRQVARSLAAGATPADAWGHLADIAGAHRLIRAAVRSADSGAALVGTLGRLADDLRAARTASAEASARRVGVLAVLPLGLCFLPAFVLTGVVPVVVAMLGDAFR
jgi:pilus assembly protein TadC